MQLTTELLVMELAVAMVHNNCIMHIHAHSCATHDDPYNGLAFDHNYANRKWPHLDVIIKMLNAIEYMQTVHGWWWLQSIDSALIMSH